MGHIAGLWENSFFKRLLLTYSFFTIGAVFLVSFLILDQTNRLLEEESSRYNTGLLRQISLFVDTYVSGSVDAFVTENFLDIARDSDIAAFFTSDFAHPMKDLYRAYRKTRSSAAGQDLIESVWLYHLKRDILLSSKEGIRYSWQTRPPVPEGAFQERILREALDSRDNRFWRSGCSDWEEWSEASPLACLISVPMFSPREKRLGWVGISLDQRRLIEQIARRKSALVEGLFLMAPGGALFSYVGEEALLPFFDRLRERPEILSSPRGSLWAEWEGREYVVSWTESDRAPWTYLSLTGAGMMRRKILTLRRAFLLILGAALPLILLLAAPLTSQLYKPVESLLRTAEDSLGVPPSGGNEMVLIDRALHSLSEQVHRMAHLMEKNEESIRRNILYDMITGRAADAEELCRRFALIGWQLRASRYAVAVLEPAEESLRASPRREYPVYLLKSLAEAGLGDRARVMVHPADRLVLLLRGEREALGAERIREELAALRREAPGIDFSLALSRSEADLACIKELYDEALGFLEYRFIYGAGQFFHPRRIRRWEAGRAPLSLEELKELRADLKSGRIDRFRRRAEELIRAVPAEGLSLGYAKTLLAQLGGVIDRAASDLNLPSGEEERPAEGEGSPASLARGEEGILRRTEGFERAYRRRSRKIDRALIEGIDRYIRENLDSRLSLRSVADRFSLSPSHLSRIYKEGTGRNFGDVIIERKFEKAADLLTAHPQRLVGEIARDLGYLNLSYFTGLFKARYGLTPQQYRKKALAASEGSAGGAVADEL